MKNIFKHCFMIISIFLIGIITLNIVPNNVKAALENREIAIEVTVYDVAKDGEEIYYKFAHTGKYKYTNSDGNFGVTYDLDSLEIPILDGYTFTGWGINAGGEVWGAGIKYSDDSTFYHCTAGRTGKVKLYGYGNTKIYPCFKKSNEPNKKVTVSYTQLGLSESLMLTTPEVLKYATCSYDPSKENGCIIKGIEGISSVVHTFNGWGDHLRCYSGETEVKVSYDTTIYPCFIPKRELSDSYLITYDANGGTNAPKEQRHFKFISGTLSKEHREVIISKKIPERSGYTFLGWSTDKSAKTATWYPGDYFVHGFPGFYEPPEIYANMDTIALYAVWKKNGSSTVTSEKYIISYDANGGTGAPSSQTKKKDEKLTISNVKPSRQGYEFIGWNKDKSATTSQYKPGDTYSNNSSITLYAVWKKSEVATQKYTISYDANGGSNAPSSQIKEKNENVKLSIIKPVRQGYEFIGWNKDKNATTSQYKPGDTYSNNSSITLYAIWKEKVVSKYLISYNANGGSNAPTSQVKEEGVTLILSDKVPTRDGYTFLGWSTDKNSTTIQYSAGSFYVNNSSITLYAVWEKNVSLDNTYVVSYDANGGIGEPSSQKKTKDKKLTLSNIQPTKEGYVFIGWSTDPYATSYQYSAGSVYAINESITLYAVWKKSVSLDNTYVVSYDANGGKNVPDKQEKERDKKLTLIDKKPTKEGYEFLGWSTDKNATTAQYSAGNVYEGNTSTTLYAVWKANEYKINYKINGGLISDAPKTALYDEEIKIKIPIKNVIVKGIKNSTGASISEDVSVMLDFEGWTSNNINEKTAYKGNKKWENGNIKSNDIVFKNLISDNGTVDLEANWKNKMINLPVVEKENLYCYWNTKPDGSGTNYESGDKYIIIGNQTYNEEEKVLNNNLASITEYDNIINLYAICSESRPESTNSKNKTGSIIVYIIIGIILVAGGYVAYRVVNNKKNI